MSEYTYIEHLNIPVKSKGTILYSYEYNATVGKINEIIDNLHVSYEYNIQLPRFDKINDIFTSISEGSPLIINDNTGKLYPVTSSAYVITGSNTTLNDELAQLNSRINSGINRLQENITAINSLITSEHEYSYAYAYSLVNSLSNDTNSKIDEINSQISTLESANEIIKDQSYLYTDNAINGLSESTRMSLENLSNDIDSLNSYLTGIINDLVNKHDTDIENVISQIPSYAAGFGINISNDNEVSVNTSEIVDNRSIYVNELGQLVVNNEVVLANAESKFKFIDENGNWVGDMSNVKNYIDNSINDTKNDLTDLINNNANDIAQLRTDMNTEVTNIYTYVNKFSEYDTFGKDYTLSKEFLQSQE